MAPGYQPLVAGVRQRPADLRRLMESRPSVIATFHFEMPHICTAQVSFKPSFEDA